MYKEYIDEKNWKDAKFGKFNYIDGAYFEAELKRCDLDYSNPNRIYEVGFGNGTFAGWAQSKGLTYFGSEVLDILVNRGVKFGFNVFKSCEIDEKLSKSSIDLIVAWDVFEHFEIEELISSLINYQNYLRPEGMILARIPSGDSPFGRSIYYGDITHKISLGTNAVRQIAEKCGYDVLEVSTPKLPIRGVGIYRGLKRLVVSISQKLIGKLINIIFHNNDHSIITSNMIFLLKKKKIK